MKGQLVLRGDCLRVVAAHSLDEYLIVWPPGFAVKDEGDEVAVVNGGGNVLALEGHEVVLGGGYGREKEDYPGARTCPSRYFVAYAVLSGD